MNVDTTTLTIPALKQMKADGRKIVGVVAWDYQMAQIVDRAGVDIVSVGDTVGVNLWGHANPLEVTLEEMLIVCKAVRRGVRRALLSCDFPYGPLQEGTDCALRAAIRLVKEAGVDMIKLDGAAEFPETVSGAGGGPCRYESRQCPGDWRVRRRTVAGWPHAHGKCRNRLRGRFH
jgi:3-methyl-2-oxobutanoate hydroxymethyltransferase